MALDASYQKALDQLQTHLIDLASEAAALDALHGTADHAQDLVSLMVDRLADMIGGFPTPVRVSRPRPRHQRPANIPKFFPPDVPPVTGTVHVEPIEGPNDGAPQ